MMIEPVPTPEEEAHLRRALQLATLAWGETHPNPMVGAVVVEDGHVVAEGWHKRAGDPHAEVMALRDLGRQPKPGAVFCVTLEPCSTQGRTPPCTDALLEAGVKRVIVGTPDPNPAHAGRGLDLLRATGVEVALATGSLAAACADLNLLFNHHVVTGAPLFALKLAVTADDKLAERAGFPSAVTGPEALADVMRWRRLFPVIAVGARTVLADDPRLTARLSAGEWCPRRLILDPRLSTVSENAPLPKVYADDFRERSTVVTGPNAYAGQAARERLAEAGVSLLELPLDASGAFSFADLRRRLAMESLSGVYFEGGADVARRLLAENALDYLFHYRSPKTFPCPEALAAPPLSAFPLSPDARRENFGDDLLIRSHLQRTSVSDLSP